MLFDERSELPDLLVLVQVEVESQRSTLAQLREVVIKTLLGDADLFCGIFEAHPLEHVVLVHVSVVQLPPLRHLLDYVADGPLLGAFVVFVGQLLGALLLGCSRGQTLLAAALVDPGLAQVDV